MSSSSDQSSPGQVHSSPLHDHESDDGSAQDEFEENKSSSSQSSAEDEVINEDVINEDVINEDVINEDVKKKKRKMSNGKSESAKKKKKSKSSYMRKNIKAILTEDKIDKETIAARKEEEERQERQRERERQRKCEEFRAQIRAQSFTSLLKPPDVVCIDDEPNNLNDLLTTTINGVSCSGGTTEIIDLSSGEEDEDGQSRVDSSSYINSLVNSVSSFNGNNFFNKLNGSCNTDSNLNSISAADSFTVDDDIEILVEKPKQPIDGYEDTNNCGAHTDDLYNLPDELGRVLVNVGHPAEDSDIYLADHLAQIVKPHQIGGIRFLYDNCIESMKQFKNSQGFGCILSHSMGLGKTLQLISFIDIFLTHTTAKYVLCIVPINTLQNWISEFNMWLPEEGMITKYLVNNDNGAVNNSIIKHRQFKLYDINDCKTTVSRVREILRWKKTGGVMLLGYEMYRILVGMQAKKKTTKEDEIDPKLFEQMKQQINDALIDPGPDLVVCDEGHRIKNCNAAVSMALKKIRTRRRIVMTGYPLQNNLIEYWCMVDFVRPNYLGTKTEFSNMFERPITNGQCSDSTPADRKLMRYRAHVLHSLLKGFVQRRSHSILKVTLPPKYEHVFMCRMTPIQKDLMLAFIGAVIQDPTMISPTGKVNPIYLFSVCCKIWNHPDVIYDLVQEGKSFDDLDIELPNNKQKKLTNDKKKKMNDKKKANGRANEIINDFSNLTTGLTSSYPSYPIQFLGSSSFMSNTKSQSQIDYSWAKPILENYQPGVIDNSIKTVLMFEIIDQSIPLGDRLLIFSQSLFTLDLIEKMLSQRYVPGTNEKWSKLVNYYRLDGSTSSLDREKFIRSFNNNEEAKLFLLSTRAGSLGVNLIGANRIIVMDASWNPCHDAQAACRIYRYGQTKPCFIYRLICDFSLEKKIYDRQVSKQGVANRVVDEQNIESNFTWREITSLLDDLHNIAEPAIPVLNQEQLARYNDDVIKHICNNFNSCLTRLPFEHESLLLDCKETKLTTVEKKIAEESYLMAKKQRLFEQQGGFTSRGILGSITGSNYFTSNNSNPYTYSSSHQQFILPNTMAPTPHSFYNTPCTQPLPASTATIRTSNTSIFPNFNSIAETLIRNGNVVKKIIMPTDLSVTTAQGEKVDIQQGEEGMLIQTEKGVYLRTRNGNIISIKKAPSQYTPFNTQINGTSFVQPNLQCGGTVQVVPSFPSSTATCSNRQPIDEITLDDDEDFNLPPSPLDDLLNNQQEQNVEGQIVHIGQSDQMQSQPLSMLQFGNDGQANESIDNQLINQSNNTSASEQEASSSSLDSFSDIFAMNNDSSNNNNHTSVPSSSIPSMESSVSLMESSVPFNPIDSIQTSSFMSSSQLPSTSSSTQDLSAFDLENYFN